MLSSCINFLKFLDNNLLPDIWFAKVFSGSLLVFLFCIYFPLFYTRFFSLSPSFLFLPELWVSYPRKTIDLNRHFSKANIQMTKRYMKKCLALLIIRRFANHNQNDILPHICWDGCFHKKNTSVGKNVEKKESLYTVEGM